MRHFVRAGPGKLIRRFHRGLTFLRTCGVRGSLRRDALQHRVRRYPVRIDALLVGVERRVKVEDSRGELGALSLRGRRPRDRRRRVDESPERPTVTNVVDIVVVRVVGFLRASESDVLLEELLPRAAQRRVLEVHARRSRHASSRLGSGHRRDDSIRRGRTPRRAFVHGHRIEREARRARHRRRRRVLLRLLGGRRDWRERELLPAPCHRLGLWRPSVVDWDRAIDDASVWGRLLRGGLRRGRGRVPLVVRGALVVFVMMKNNPRAGMRGWPRALHRSMRHPLHGGRDARVVVEGNDRGCGEHRRTAYPTRPPIAAYRRAPPRCPTVNKSSNRCDHTELGFDEDGSSAPVSRASSPIYLHAEGRRR